MARRSFKPLEGAKENNVIVHNSTWKYISATGGIEQVSGDKGVTVMTYELPSGFKSRVSWMSEDAYGGFLGGLITPHYTDGYMSRDADNSVEGVFWQTFLDPAYFAAIPGFEQFKSAVAFEWLKVSDATPADRADLYDSSGEKGMGFRLSFWFRNSSV